MNGKSKLELPMTSAQLRSLTSPQPQVRALLKVVKRGWSKTVIHKVTRR